MAVPKNNKLLPCARVLRRNMTPQERKLWYDYLKDYPVKIYKQRIIASYIADFYCASARLVIEIDGSQHYTSDGEMNDFQRSKQLESYSLKVIRFTNPEIDHCFESVCDRIDKVIRWRTAPENSMKSEDQEEFEEDLF